ncbi:glycosyltransferase family 58 protein [Pisolithus croceorrhizus]|nr:glycosyltransferase family 58 protein [Pisolithus croceorrhizus]
MAIGATKSTPFSPSCLLRAACSLVLDKRYFWTLATLVIVCDAVLTQLIIKFIPYTEIDWETYMVHIDLYLSGERDYSKITGPTGPLVYPAGHVYIHDILHYLTDSGKNVAAAQRIYAGLYVLSLLLTCAVYRNAGMPNWTLLLLPLSKRLHSIFVLRLFNDCWSVVFVQAAILACQTGVDGTGVLLYSLALSVKMSALLYLPGLLVVLFKRHGMVGTARYMVVLAGSQILLARPFLGENTVPYIQNAFQFFSCFLTEMDCQLALPGRGSFLKSLRGPMGLLLSHITVLMAFGLCKWCKSDGGTLAVIRRGFLRPFQSPALSSYIATVLMTSNLIGILFARSLHYQFYSWYCQQLPLLCQRTKYPLLLQLVVLVGIEYAWNVFPSTALSSGILLTAHVLLLLGIWFGFPEGKAVLPHSKRKV